MPKLKMTAKSEGANNKCVCCGVSLRKHKSHLVFDEYGKFRRIQFLLAECLNKTVTEEPGGMQSICVDCLNQLDQNYAFKLKCAQQASDESEGESDVEESVDNASAVECVLPEEAQIEKDVVKSEPVEIDQNVELQKSPSLKDVSFVIGFSEDTHLSESAFKANDKPMEIVDFDLKSHAVELVKNEEEDQTMDSVYLIDENDELHECAASGTDEVEVEYLDYYDEDNESENPLVTTIRNPPLQMQFVETLVLHNIKDKIREGIPFHRHEETKASESHESRVVDVKNNVPDLQIECAEYGAKDDDPIDIDDYFRSIITVSFCEFTPFVGKIKCKLCLKDSVIENYLSLVEHTQQVHSTAGGQLFCCLGDCSTFADQSDLNNHYFQKHGDVINAYTFLNCQTCDLGTESLVKFGKHVCSNSTLPDPPVDNKYMCNTCNINLVSRRRNLFHQQFHLPSPRPKVCLVCDTVFRNEKTFYDHVMFAHEEFFQYFCQYCDKSFTIEAELQRHEHRHTAVRSFVCNDCDKAFFDQQSLTTHNLIHLPGFYCEYCNQHFNRKSRLRKHMLSTHVVHSPAVLSVCDRCGQAFANAEKANRHWNTAHADDEAATPQITSELAEKVLCCEFCEAAYMDVDQLADHKKTHGDAVEKYECQFCPAKYKDYSRLKTHTNCHVEINQLFPVKRWYVCDVAQCFKPYSDWRNFQNHRKTVHLINPSVIRCDQCDAVFYKSWSYSYHLKSVHSEHMQCPYCTQTFVMERSLEMHIAKKHISITDSTSAPKRRSKHHELITEYFTIESNGEYTCVACDRTINRRNNAIAHVKMMHLNERDFVCEICSKSFFHRGDLNTHMRLHNEETPYKCPHCPHSTRSKSMLTVHIRKHTNERPYQCEKCPKAFKRLLVMKNHMRLHGDKEFQCEICETAFYTKDTLLTHTKSKHGPDAGVRRQKPSAPKKPPSVIIVMYGSTTESSQPPNEPLTTTAKDPKLNPPKVYKLKTHTTP